MNRFLARLLAVGSIGVASVTIGVAPAGAGVTDVATFHGLVPARLMDTRPGSPTIDGSFDGDGPVRSNEIVNVVVLGRGGVPATGVGAVALNVTVTNPTAAGFLTVYPTSGARPTASNLNFVAGQTIPNMVIVPLNAAGQVTIFNGSAGTSNVIVDVLGWFPTGAAFSGAPPARLLDTRAGLPTVDSTYAGVGALGAFATLDLPVLGRGSVPTSGVGAVAVNLTVDAPSGAGFLTAYPTGGTRPTASNLNFVTGQTIPNMVIVPVGAGGRISIYNGSAGTSHVVVDVLGWFPAGSSFTGLTPTRLLDTRPGSLTIDNRFAGGKALAGPGVLNLTVTGRGGVPATGVGAVALNVTVTNPDTPGFLTVFPHGTSRPTASNLNFAARRTIANMVIVPVGNAGQISIFSLTGAVDIVVDVLGWFPNPTVPPTVYGNDLTLRSNGVGTAVFGNTPTSTIAVVSAVFGPANYDFSETFPDFDGMSTYSNPATGHAFVQPAAREVCWDEGLCLTFGGATLPAVTFVGWSYGGDVDALLNDANGLGLGSRGSDLPGAITMISEGGCYFFGSGESATGITLELFSIGTPFLVADGSMPPVLNRPAQSEVVVVLMYSGSGIGSLEGDC